MNYLHKRNVMFICHGIKPGRNTVQFQRASSLCDHYNVRFFCYDPVCDEIAAKAKDISCYPLRKIKFLKCFFCFWAVFRVWRLYSQDQVDLAYTSFHVQSILTGYGLKCMGLKWIADIWDDPGLSMSLRNLRKGIYSNLVHVYNLFFLHTVKRVLSSADLIIIALVPELLAAYNVNADTTEVLSVTNGVDLSITVPQPRRTNEGFRIVYVGPVMKARSLDIILEAARLIKDKIPGCRWELAGAVARAEKDWLTQKMNEMGLHQYMEVPGEVRHDQALESIDRADVCLCILSPLVRNYHFAYPIKLLEYMAMKKAIICTRMPGTASIVRHGETALLVPPQDPKALAEAILRLYHDPQLRERLACQAADEVQAYDWKIINQKIGSAVEKCLKD